MTAEGIKNATPYELREFVNSASAWDKPLVMECMEELCSRVGIDINSYSDMEDVEAEIDKRLGTEWHPW